MAEGSEGMVRTRSWTVLFLVLMTGAGCTPMDDLLVSIFGRSMRDQPSIGAYEDPRLPPEGAVSFASGNFPGAPGEVAVGQPEGTPMPAPITPLMLLQGHPDAVDLENPIEADDASLERGEELYLRACAPCHGDAGAGGGPVTAAGVASFTIIEGQALEHSDGYLYSIIRVGRGSMPAYGHQLTHYDRWHVVNYVRQLQGNLPQQQEEASDDSGEEG
ncbi:MAG: cytochrome c [Gemmatimonadales bacterium]|nr:MAG: cytochrome c [Gemmatimonadales bacterium]